MLKTRFTALALAGLLLTTSGCAATTPAGTGAGSTYKIGFIAAETGPFAFAGTSYAKGAKLAQKRINDQKILGDGKSVEIIFEEGNEAAAQAISAANRLMSQDVVAITCCMASPVAAAVGPITTAKNTPLVIHGASLKGLTTPPYVYRTNMLPTAAMQKLAEMVAEGVKPKSVSYVVTSDNEGLQAQLQALKAGFSAEGVADSGTVSVLTADTDFSGAVTDLVSKKAEAVAISATGEASAALARELRSRGYKGQILGNSYMASKSLFETAGPALAGIPFPVDFAPYSEEEATKAFVKDFEAEYGAVPDIYAAVGYHAIKYIAEAIKRAGAGGTVDKKSVATALESITEMNDVLGPVTFKEGEIHIQDIKIAAWDASGKMVKWVPGT